MAFTPKDWRDSPGDTTTPLNAAALEDLETRLSAYTDSVVAGGGIAIPTGIIQWTAAAAAPAGWLAADGTAVSRTTYAGLYAALGGAASPYGQGNGTTTFNLPNLRDRTAMGSGGAHALGVTGGADTVALATAELPVHSHAGPSHTHSISSDGAHTHPPLAPYDFFWAADSGAATNVGFGSAFTAASGPATTGSAGAHTHGGATGSGGNGATGSTGSGTAHENLPPYLALLPIIKT